MTATAQPNCYAGPSLAELVALHEKDHYTPPSGRRYHFLRNVLDGLVLLHGICKHLLEFPVLVLKLP